MYEWVDPTNRGVFLCGCGTGFRSSTYPSLYIGVSYAWEVFVFATRAHAGWGYDCLITVSKPFILHPGLQSLLNNCESDEPRLSTDGCETGFVTNLKLTGRLRAGCFEEPRQFPDW